MDSSKLHRTPANQGCTTIGSVKLPRRFKKQDFSALKEFHLKNGSLFEDVAFPANMESIGPKLEHELRSRKIEWMRPKLSQSPRLFVDGISMFDIRQSEIGNCWVLSVLGTLTFKENLLKNIIPFEQDYDQHYAGIFHFRFWSFGDWWDVVIDDKLPFVDGRYLSVQPSTMNEFWPCLLEKAYAKFLGSYQNLHFGNPAEAFVNFTGWTALTFDLKTEIQQSDLFHIIKNASPDTVMTCTSKMKEGLERSQSLNQETLYKHENIRRSSAPVTKIPEKVHLGHGLVERHAYSVVGIEQVHFRNKTVILIQMWNPWGYGEWTGSWSDISPCWAEVSEGERRRLYKLKEDGQFWMCWEDFIEKFSRLVICSHSTNFLDWEHQPKKWYRQMFTDTWPKGTKTGNNDNEDFITKIPQYLIKVNACDEVKRGHNVAVSLMQHPFNRLKFNGDWPLIGLEITNVHSKFFDSKERVSSSLFSKEILSRLEMNIQNKRDITLKFNLASGTYLILPCIKKTSLEFPYMLQIFLKSKDCAISLVSQQSIERDYSAPIQHNHPRRDELNYEETFRKYASQENKMNVQDLQRFLNEVFLKDYNFPSGFTKDSSRSMLISTDSTGTGSLGAENFARLWRRLTRFKDVYRDMDINPYDSLDIHKFRRAVDATGLQVTRHQLNHLVLLYGNSEHKIYFMDYLVCMVRLKGVADAFRQYSADERGVYLSHEKMMQLMI